MKRKIEDYLHLYIGQDATIEWKDNTIIPSNWEDGIHKLTGLHVDYVKNMKSCQIHLRPLRDITEKEHDELVKINPQCRPLFPYVNHDPSNEFLYAIGVGFDLFELIEAGLAIDKTKLK